MIKNEKKTQAQIIKEWQEKYGRVKKPVGDVNLTQVIATRHCVVCNTDKNIQRHHKANDFLFARLLPDIYAKRYIEYRSSDCDNLCSDCHSAYHKHNDLFVFGFWYWYNELAGAPSDNSKIAGILDSWRQIFLFTYETWKADQIKWHTSQSLMNKKKNTRSKRSKQA